MNERLRRNLIMLHDAVETMCTGHHSASRPKLKSDHRCRRISANLIFLGVRQLRSWELKVHAAPLNAHDCDVMRLVEALDYASLLWSSVESPGVIWCDLV